MQLSTRQVRLFTLATLLGTGKPVPSDEILATFRCSEATLTRTFKELRDTWSAEIRYRKASHTYEMTDSGTLDRKTLKKMSEELENHNSQKSVYYSGKVSLDKEKKKAVSLSLTGTTVRKIAHLSMLSGKTRSDAVEMLVNLHIDELIESIIRRNESQQKK
ncbi:tellurium resistance protein TerW [Morganella morganii subsp. morganii]|uniref:tellurium resistance protein TerW n=1 Tax=Morganella morganii TaxID=582 RepID=UPI001BDB57DF|nr:tellurium resistance protein TerW [Morganella morganii]MBT0389626.1 tellurium resistance protein TerW [Morganella morganii subsp. morganii]